MPNLEYSVRFVLASDSTSEIDQALAKMRDTGSTITVKVNADIGEFTADMAKVNAELAKTEQANQKMGNSTQKSSKDFRDLSKSIKETLNQFKATGNLEQAGAEFGKISAKVNDFGNSVKDSAKGMQEFYTLTNQITSATAILNREQNNSAGVIKANEAVQRSLNEETKKSAQILATRARASKFDSDQAKAANTAMANSVRGVVTELRLLSNSGTATAEQLERLFGRTMTAAKDTQVTTMDLSKAFSQQKAIVEASAAPYHQRMALLKQIRNEEQLAAGQIRNVNRTLGQQENQVGDVSYAMVSFTRLLEDMPYGFRGFANNIQPTVYGLIQLNSATELMATRFRGIHKREMPLMARAMINMKRALSSPINQLLLFTSVVAVAGTMIERWVQQARKAGAPTRELGDQFLRLYDVIKGDNPLETDYAQSIAGLEEYINALKGVQDGLENTVELAGDLQTRIKSAGARDVMPDFDVLTEGEGKRLLISKQLSDEGSKRLKDMISEAEVLKFINESEGVRAALQRQATENRVRQAEERTLSLSEELRIEKVLQSQGQEAAARERFTIANEKIIAEFNEKKINEAQRDILLNEQKKKLELDLLRLKKDEKKETKEIRAEYEGILLSLQRQLEDEKAMSDQAKLRVAREREITDLHKTIAARRREGEEISFEQETKLYDAIEARYDLIEAREERARRRTIQSYGEQNILLGAQNTVLDTLLKGDFARAEVLEFGLTDLQYQNDLAELNYEISQKTFDTDEEALEYQRLRVSLLEQEYQIKLKNQVLSARSEVTSFLAPELSPIGQIEEKTNSALLASKMSFLAEKASIEQQYAVGTSAREQALTDMYARQEAERKAIALKGTTEIQDIKSKGYIEGSMIIVGALEQLNQSSEATNKRAFERQKSISAGLATINTLLGITQVLSDKNIPSTFLKYAQAAALAAIGFAQVRKIRSAQYGGSSSSGGSIGSRAMSQGFTEVDMTRNATAGVGSTVTPQRNMNNITVIGNVDREGIAFAVRDGEDSIASRATFAI